MDRPSWAPEGVDMQQVSPARMYDALLGGSHNFEIDRMAAEMGKKLVPDLPRLALSNRAFLRRSVRYLVEAGITQFVDIGSGIPTVGNVHEVAQAIDPSIRVLYVDIDPVAVTHARSLLHGNDNANAIEGDLRKPAELMERVRESGLIDLERPVGVLMIAVLHMLADADDPAGKVAALYDAVVDGSYIAISHLTSELRPDDAAALGASASNSSKVGIHFRPAGEIIGMFDRWAPVEPGVVELSMWRPESERDRLVEPGRSLALAGVGRKV